jgi:glycosyltransferase involved in cell wall biosynthesis
VIRDERLRVVLLIRSLNRGGAERQLALLAAGLDPQEFQVGVVTFYRGGPIWDELAAVPHVELVSLDKKGRWDNLGPKRRLETLLTAWAPAVLHCYLAEPSIVGTIAGRRAGVPAIVWGVRSSNVDYRKYGWFNRGTFRLASLLSRRPNLIIANSDAGRSYHVAHGYPADRVVTIPNGIDTERFTASLEARASGRRRWQLSEGDLVIGVIARLDPMKGHEVLLKSVASISRQMANVRVICVGGGEAGLSTHLADETRRLNLEKVVQWVGEAGRTELLYSVFDIACSSSVFGEGFSNAIAEAMACERPCVVTDVGDSKLIVGDTGFVAPPADPDALADSLLEMAKLPVPDRGALGRRARARIVSEFGLRAMIQRTAAAYRELAGRRADGETTTSTARPST